jgi:large subunit ribosomal protein L25
LPAVAGERIRLDVKERERRGSAESRRLRKQGLVPGVLYGRGKKPHAICVPERELRRALTGSAGLHAILDVVLDGHKSTHASILKDYQRDPLRGGITHVDLQEVRLDQPIQAQVVVELTGDSVGVREGGVLSQVTREVTVEALPMEIPEHLEVDVSAMAIGDTLRLSEVAVPKGVSLVDDPEEIVIATVTMPTRVEVPEEMVAEGEPQVTEGLAEGEKPEGATEQPAEPEADAAGSPGTVEG